MPSPARIRACRNVSPLWQRHRLTQIHRCKRDDPHFARLRCRHCTARAGLYSKPVFGHCSWTGACPKREVDSRYRPPDGTLHSIHAPHPQPLRTTGKLTHPARHSAARTSQRRLKSCRASAHHVHCMLTRRRMRSGVVGRPRHNDRIMSASAQRGSVDSGPSSGGIRSWPASYRRA